MPPPLTITRKNKGSIFYAESWGADPLLYTKDRQQKTQLWGDYNRAAGSNKVDPVTAATARSATQAQLQSNLEAYVRQGSFNISKLAAATALTTQPSPHEP